jgi:hypothetical protein
MKTIKTYSELLADCAAIATELDNKCLTYNEAALNDDFHAMAVVDGEMKELEKSYVETAQALVFTSLKDKEQPMLEAIKTWGFKVLKHKDSAESGSTTKTREIIEAERQFDLREFDAFCGYTASANKSWSNFAERMNMLCAIHVANELKVADLASIGTSYFISKTKDEIKLADENADVANPISNTQMLKMLQQVLDKIIYEDNEGKNKYRAKSQDVAWLLFTYGRKDSKGRLTLKLADHKQFRKVLADVLHRIVTNADYKVAYKQMLAK